MKAVLKMREAEQRSDKRRPESPGKESWNSAKPFLTCREGRVNKEGLGQEERRECRERLRRERSRHLLQELKHGALRVLGCCDGEVDAVLARA
jgi:hypothetical protein